MKPYQQDPLEESDKGPLFYISQKVDAFAESFTPCRNEEEADEVFTDHRLREYFHAYPRPTGDPLVDYAEALALLGFHMHTTLMGEPAIFVKWK